MFPKIETALDQADVWSGRARRMFYEGTAGTCMRLVLRMGEQTNARMARGTIVCLQSW